MLSKTELARRIRRHSQRELYDDSGAAAIGTAIYSLADPRELGVPRYIGQTSAPRRRFLQHLGTARLWMPDDIPWWVMEPRLRPLYEWLRELHRDDYRLPTMIIHNWADTTKAARLAERARIFAALANAVPLLNVEREILAAQMPLL
jgi:hypothetical protein